MSKAPSGWQELLNLIIKDKQTRKAGRWLCCLGIIALLWWLNWKLFLATSVGIGLMSLCYLLQNPYWQRYCKKWQDFLVGSNRQLIIAVGIGAAGSFCTYLAASIWVEAENQWLATGAILQGFVSLATLSTLLWSLWHRKENTIETKLDSLLADLSHADALKRLVAIRQLTRLLIDRGLTCDRYSQSIEYFRLMLSQPQLPTVTNALLESLDLLNAQQVIRAKRPPVKIPIQLQHSRKSIQLAQD